VKGLHWRRFRSSKDLAPAQLSIPALSAAIDAASLIKRESDDDGYRVIVMCDSLGGCFIYSREVAEQRIRKFFPELSVEGVGRAMRHLEDKVRIYLQPVKQADRARSSWVMGWAD